MSTHRSAALPIGLTRLRLAHKSQYATRLGPVRPYCKVSGAGVVASSRILGGKKLAGAEIFTISDLPSMQRRRSRSRLCINVGNEDFRPCGRQRSAFRLKRPGSAIQGGHAEHRPFRDGEAPHAAVSSAVSTDTSWCPDPMRASVVDPQHAGSPAPWIPPF
jgi:hypothetical protein